MTDTKYKVIIPITELKLKCIYLSYTVYEKTQKINRTMNALEYYWVMFIVS